MTTAESEVLRHSPLHEQHVALGAKLGDFNGWLMPIEYSGTLAEHAAVRERVALFDVSHMGKVRVHGAGAAEWLNGVLTNDLNKIAAGQAQYSMLCNSAGGVIDDLIVYRWADDELFIVPNAGNSAEVVSVLRALAPAEVTVDDHHLDHGIIAVQGPQSAQLLEALGLPSEHDYMSMVAAEFEGQPIVVARTGYTGEHGYELVVPVGVISDLWSQLLTHAQPLGGLAAGLGARDTLRLEMGYPLHGHELSPEISPVEARVGWAVGWDKPTFEGRDSLVAQRSAGATRVLRGLLANERGIPRADCQVTHDEKVVGLTTSGTFSPTLGQGIALALLDASISEGDVVQVDVRGRPLSCTVTRPPFVSASTR
jgi:aminomethyltransferase